MNANEARDIFNSVIANCSDAEQIARIEICREYFTNPEFRAALEAHVYAINNG